MSLGDPRDGHGALAGEAVPVGLGLDEGAEVDAGEEDAVALGAGPQVRSRADVRSSRCRTGGRPSPGLVIGLGILTHVHDRTPPRYCTCDHCRRGHRLRLPRRDARATRARCWRSPTAAAPTTPTSRASRTPCAPSSTPSSSATSTSRPTCTSPSDGVLLAFHDTVLDRVTDATGAIATSTYAEVQRALINGSDPVPTLGRAVRRVPRRPLQHRPEVGRRRARAGRGSSTSARRGTGSASGRSPAGGCAGSAASPGPGGDLGVARRGGGVPAAARSAVARLVTRGRPQVLQVPHR